MSRKINFKQLIGVTAFMSVASIASSAPSVSLMQTVGTDLTPATCATSSVAIVNLGTSLNFCYTVTNDGDVPFDLHELSTSAFGTLAPAPTGTLAPAATMQFNDIRTLSSDVFNNGTWAASNPPAITVNTSTGGFEDISTTGTLIPELDDDGEVAVVIPFSFNYFGMNSTDLYVGNNGAALFGVTSGSVSWNNHALVAGDAGLIAPFWDDLGVSATTGDVYTETMGVAPNRHFIVQWHQEIGYNGDDADNITFQIALYEGTNEIQFRYLDVIFGGGDVDRDSGLSATVGIVSPNGSTISEYSYNGSTLLIDDDVISYTFIPGESASDSSLAAVDVLVPQVAASPNTVTLSLEEGAANSATLDISNSGEGELDWSVNESSVAKTLHTRPISIYTPETTDFPSQFADFENFSDKFIPSKTSTSGLIGTGGPVAYAYDLRNGFFGNIDHTNPGAFNAISTSNDSFYAGDFIAGDYTTLYAVRDDQVLHSINVADGTPTMIAAVTGGAEAVGVSGLSEDPTDGTVYISATDGTNSYLYTFDIATALSTLVGEVTNSALLIDIAVSPSGEIFGVDLASDSLISIDKITGAGTVVGALGVDISYAQGMDFDNFSNTLYLAAYIGGGVNEVRTIDVATGASTVVGSVNPNTGGAELDSFAIPADVERCAFQEDIAWLSLSTTSGTTLAGDTDQITVDFDASALSAGMYHANVCVFSNDPDEPLVKVPVDLEVTLPDLIFANGFETP